MANAVAHMKRVQGPRASSPPSCQHYQEIPWRRPRLLLSVDRVSVEAYETPVLLPFRDLLFVTDVARHGEGGTHPAR